MINLISGDATDDEGDFRAYLEEEPEEVRNAWEELMMIQMEQQRYSDIRSQSYKTQNNTAKLMKKRTFLSEA